MLFSLFLNFHIFHFPTMRWPTSPLASDGPVMYLYFSVWGVLYCHRYYCQRLKPFVISIWGAHYCHQYKFIDIRLWGDQKFSRDQQFQTRLWDQRFWIASSANTTPCNVYTRHCIWESTDVKRIQDFYRAAATTVKKINVDKSVWNYFVRNEQLAKFTFESSAKSTSRQKTWKLYLICISSWLISLRGSLIN